MKFITKVFFAILGCSSVDFEEISFFNVNGAYNLISITDTSLSIQSGRIQGIMTYSPFIFTFLDSTASFSNLSCSQFYPNLIYATFTFINISNCSFLFSFEKFGNLEVCAIYLEYNMSFIISNSKFDSLSNSLGGPVNICFSF